MTQQALPDPLHKVHEQTDAEFQAYGEVLQIVSTFGQPQAEYAAIRKGCGMMDLPQRGILEVSGRDRLSFLNNLLTNQTWEKQKKAGLEPGKGVYAFLLNNKGRILADMNVLELGERTLLEMDGRMVEPVRAALEKYLFAEQVKLVSRVGELHEIALHGPGAEQVLGELVGREDVGGLAALDSRAVRIMGRDVIVWRDDPAGVPGYYLVVPTEAAESVWMDLRIRFGGTTGGSGDGQGAAEAVPGKRALRAVGWAAFNATRIEAGRPIFGIDFDESVLPGETGQLSRAVSFTKGCYVGQEIVARMQSRGQVARQLVGIRMNDDALPMAGTKVLDGEGNEIGGITSSTISPVLSGAAICLGYVKRASAATGTVLRVPAEGAIHEGKVVELPFLR